MKRSSKTIAMLLAGTMLLGGTGAAMAGKHYDRGHCDKRGEFSHQGIPMKALKRLDTLSDEQRDQIKTLFREQRDKMRDLRDAMQDNREDLYEAMQNNSDEKTLLKLAEKQGDLVTDMIMNRIQQRKQLNAILTAEQRETLQKMQKRRMEKRRDRDDDDERRGRW